MFNGDQVTGSPQMLGCGRLPKNAEAEDLACADAEQSLTGNGLDRDPQVGVLRLLRPGYTPSTGAPRLTTLFTGESLTEPRLHDAPRSFQS
jgi:hypothetical protein